MKVARPDTWSAECLGRGGIVVASRMLPQPNTNRAKRKCAECRLVPVSDGTPQRGCLDAEQGERSAEVRSGDGSRRAWCGIAFFNSKLIRVTSWLGSGAAPISR